MCLNAYTNVAIGSKQVHINSNKKTLIENTTYTE